MKKEEEDALKIIEGLFLKFPELPSMERVKADAFLISSMSLLRVIPKFEDEIRKIRERYGINPEILSKKLKLLVKDPGLLEVIQDYETVNGFDKIYYEHYLRHTNPKIDATLLNSLVLKAEKGYKKVEEFENKNFPRLLLEINALRIFTFKKIPEDWTPYIKRYLLYNDISAASFSPFKEGRVPEIHLVTDAKTFEPYVQIKVFGNTSIDALKENLPFVHKLQKSLPTYNRLTEDLHKNIQRSWLYYFLRTQAHLTNKMANDVLSLYGFKTVAYQYDSQELKRFEEHF